MNKLYDESKIQDIANAIRSKGQTGTMTVSQMASKINAIATKENVTWHQCPVTVKNYLENVTYNPADYSTSQIATYAPATVVQSNTKPISKTVDGVTYYNEVPNVETPFSSDNMAGTLKPLDALRWINTSAINVRDLGGWSCDGGTVKYGMMFRGGQVNADDINVLVNKCGVRAELNLRGKNDGEEQPASSPLGEGIMYFIPERYQWYSIADDASWREMIKFIFECVSHNQPVYFHCSAGADRTGTFACVIEALLGMSQSDIDKDYELTCFATGTGTDTQARRRNESDWIGLINEIKASPLEGGLTDTFRNRVVSFVLSLGFTIDEINQFRHAMINGTPTDITASMDEYSVSKNAANITFDNTVSSVDAYQDYSVNISADKGYVISDVSITMGGSRINAFSGKNVNLFRKVTYSLEHCSVNNTNYSCIDGQCYGAVVSADDGYTLDGGTISIKIGGVEMSQQYYSNGTIIIPKVTGDIVINITAVKQGPSYTNIWATPYKLNARLNTSETDPDRAGAFISAWYPITSEQMTGDIVLRSNKDIFNVSQLATSGDYIRLYPSQTAGSASVSALIPSASASITYDSAEGVYKLTIPHSAFSQHISQIQYFRWCAQISNAAVSADTFNGCILTINEEIQN